MKDSHFCRYYNLKKINEYVRLIITYYIKNYYHTFLIIINLISKFFFIPIYKLEKSNSSD